MRIAQRVQQFGSGKASISDQKIKFVDRSSPDPYKQTPEKVARSKAVWTSIPGGVMGPPPIGK